MKKQRIDPLWGQAFRPAAELQPGATPQFFIPGCAGPVWPRWGSRVIRLAAILTALSVCGPVFAQEDQPQPNQRQRRREQVTPAPWPPLRLPDGQPDISGYWDPAIGGTYSLTNPSRGGVGLQDQLGIPRKKNPSRIIDPADGEIPYLPWAREKQKYIAANINEPVKEEFIDPQARCLPDGPIRATFWHTVHILQYPGYVIFNYEGNHPHRIVPLDGRPALGDSIKLWMGDSRGHWEGNTLVIDVRNNNSKSRLSNVGDFASENLHIVERYTFLDGKSMRYEARMDDPAVYTRPWTIASDFHRTHTDPTYEQWEEACHEGERNVDDSLDLSRAATAK